MSNTINVQQMFAREGAAMLEEMLPFSGGINRGREEEFKSKPNGFRLGQTVQINIPPVPTVYSGAVLAGGGSVPGAVEGKMNLTVGTQKHVPVSITSLEKALTLGNEEEARRIIKPYISALASVVEADFIAKATCQVANEVGTAGQIPTAMTTYQDGRAKLQQFLAPDDDRRILFSSDANSKLVDASKVLFNPVKEISQQYLKGVLGEAQGMTWFESQALSSLTYGNNVTGMTVSGSSQTGTSLLIAGTSNGTTFKKGSVFTIDSVYAVHPLTSIAYPALRQFVITADVTATTSTCTLSVWPPIQITTGASNQTGPTVNALPVSGKALTFGGAANTTYRKNLIYQADAIATAFVPLEGLPGTRTYTATTKSGMSLRVMTGGDFVNDLETTRIDVLYADPVLIRPDHCCRVTE